MKKLTVYLVFAMLVVSSLSLGFAGKASADIGNELELFLEEEAAKAGVTTAVAEEKKAPKEYRVLEPEEEELSEQLIEEIAATAGPGF